MEITFMLQDDRVAVTVMQVKGDINAATYQEFQAHAKQAIDSGMRNMLIDLSHTQYVSSAGLRAINQIFKWLEPNVSGKELAAGKYKARHLKFLAPSPRVLEILKMAGYDMFIEIHTDLDNAIAAFQ